MKYALGFILALVSPIAIAASSMRSFDLRSFIWDVVVLLGVAVIFGLLRYGVKEAPFIDEPWKGFILWGILLIAILVIIYIILGWIGL